MDGEWVDGSLFIDEKKEKHEILVGYVNYRVGWEVDPATIGQYTGLKDKNGKKIFEGDIVKFDKKYYEVKYEMGQFFFGINMPIAYKRFEIEVIGNIHDNPELLKGKKNE